MKSFRAAPLEVVRAMIANGMLDPPDAVPARLGVIELRDHQRITAARLVKACSVLAVGARIGGDVLTAVPAALRAMWEQALRDCRMAATIVTHEALSRGLRPGGSYTLVLVDEAHRLRSPAARRYDAIADICRRARVLLVTATPVQNRRDDLAAQLALFLGRRAWQMSDAEIARYVVRGDATGRVARPR